MEKFGILSRNIVLKNEDIPVYGLLLIQDGIIQEIIRLHENEEYEEVSSRFSEIKIEDYSNYYVWPGKIDLNVNTNSEWEGRTQATQSAISEGTTLFLEQPALFDFQPDQGDLYCDIAQMQLLSDDNLWLLEQPPKQTIFGYKAYFDKPSEFVGKFSKLQETADKLKQTGIPLFLDVSLPDEKGLFGASPCHTLPLNSRVDWNAEVQHYSGGIAYDIEDTSSESEKEEEKEDKAKGQEPYTPAVFLDRQPRQSDQVANLISSRNNRQLNKKRSSSQPQKSRARTNYDAIFKEQYQRIRRTQLTIEALAAKDLSEYAGGKTSYLAVDAGNEMSSDFKLSSISFNQLDPERELSPVRNSPQVVVSNESTPGTDERTRYKRNKVSPPKKESLEAVEEVSQTSTDSSIINLPTVLEVDGSEKLYPLPLVTTVSAPPPATSPIIPKRSFRDRMKTAMPGLSITTQIVKPKEKKPKYLYLDHLANCTEYWETSGVDILIKTKGIQGLPIHIWNLSSARALSKIKKYNRKLKLNITTEISAPMLFFWETSIQPGKTLLKGTPPIRSLTNSNLLWEWMKIMAIDWITSGHNPISPQYKFIEDGNFRRAVSGINCLGYTLSSVWTKLQTPLQHGTRSYQHYIVRMFKWLSEIPANILGVSDKRGSIKIGAYADLWVWQPEEFYKAVENYSKYPQIWPYKGEEMRGCIYKVYLRGNLAYDSGSFQKFGMIIERT